MRGGDNVWKIDSAGQVTVVSRKIDGDVGRLGDVDRLGEAARARDVERRPRLQPVPGKAASELTTLADVEDGRTSATRKRASPSDDIADFITPKLAEPAILQSGRALGILEHLIRDIVPTLAASKEFREFATAAVATEIARRRHLLARLHRGIAT
jgi:hypothetical protein